MKFLLGLMTLSLFLVFPHPASALKISPFKATLVPTMDGGTQVFRVDNNSAEPAAVQVSVMTWTIAPDGTETNEDADDLFVVFPAQLVLKAHESRAVRVQWLGEQDLSVERPYRIIAEQIPITLQDTSSMSSGLLFMVKFMGGLYVGPQTVKSEIVVDGVEPKGGKLRVTLSNKGTGHSLLDDAVLHLTAPDGHEISIKDKDLGDLLGANIHAGGQRYFDIPAPSGAGNHFSSAHIEYKQGF